jgi:hypothetical protein
MNKPLRRFANNNAFGPEALGVMSEAFDIAWSFVERSHPPSTGDSAVLREILARNIIMSARLGETSKVALANFAIVRLRSETRPARGRI